MNTNSSKRYIFAGSIIQQLEHVQETIPNVEETSPKENKWRTFLKKLYRRQKSEKLLADTEPEQHYFKGNTHEWRDSYNLQV